MSKRNKGQHNSPETEYAPRAILCVELNRIFSTISEAARYINRSISSIWGPLNGKGKTAAGYHWRYLNSAEIAALTTPSQDTALSMDFDSSFPTQRQEDAELAISA